MSAAQHYRAHCQREIVDTPPATYMDEMHCPHCGRLYGAGNSTTCCFRIEPIDATGQPAATAAHAPAHATT